MKNKVISLLLIFFTFFLFSGCNPPNNTNIIQPYEKYLSPPIISYSKGLISWNKIEQADKYEISINDEIFVTYNTYYKLNVSESLSKYTVKVKSISENKNYYNSFFSSPINFETFSLSTPNISNAYFDDDKSYVSFDIYQKDAEFYNLYINNEFIKAFNENTFKINKEQLHSGQNEITVHACVNDPYICDSYNTLDIFKNNDYLNLRIQDGQLIYTENNEDMIYDTSTFPAGIYDTVIYNNNYMPGIYFPSNGALFTIKKLFSAQVLECYFIKKPQNFQPLSQIYLKIQNYSFGCDKIEIITNEYLDVHNSYTTDSFTTTDTYIECTFNLEEWSLPNSIEIILHRDGYISSNKVTSIVN